MLYFLKRRNLSCGNSGRPGLLQAHGFSLIEPIVAAALTAIVLAQIASIFDISRRAIVFSNQIDEADRDIHLALDVTREAVVNYNWCVNGGAVNATCNGMTPLNGVAFYNPPQANLQAFQAACRVDSHNNASEDPVMRSLNTYIDNTLSGQPIVNNVRIRVIEMDAKEIHRFRTMFEKTISTPYGDRTLRRGFYLIPPLALWCI